ncbi:YndJ family protein [Sporosarcina sp. FSL K6-1508]|uniref:YndJ family protein n=1 Tax=Sporosarcina sp. FSL K6-1508 TaxID=2921553 RepID=UPI0030F7EDA5
MTMCKFALIHSVLFVSVAFFSLNPWPFLMLTIAQLVYVPIAIRFVMEKENWFSQHYYYFAIPAYLAVALLHIVPGSKWDGLLAAIYLAFTFVIALYGLTRFFNRGFTNLEEFAIDAGLVYISLGGAWFFAYVTGIDTGFSPLITWLTGIHFHYSAFLLPIFIGLLGRIYKPPFFRIMCTIILVSPLLVAIGITFSRWIELLSVGLYIIGLSGLIFIAWKTPFKNHVQKWLIRISFGALGVTIIFSLLYALGSGFGLTSVNIDFMLRFHGVLNCLVFALVGIVGWSITIPAANFHPPTFPISRIRGKRVIGEQVLEGMLHEKHPGLVDDMKVYGPSLQCNTLSPRIIDFYENTINYRLFATIKWRSWFKPFAFVYELMSRKTQQIHLPLHGRQVEMTGDVIALQDTADGRDKVRAWIRKIGPETAFVALYSQHEKAGRMYMNIDLPLPFSTMTGILELHQVGDDLQLTSKKKSSYDSDAGIYLSFLSNQAFKLPIDEDFSVSDGKDGSLSACHTMRLFSIPFLTIRYLIRHVC